MKVYYHKAVPLSCGCCWSRPDWWWGATFYRFQIGKHFFFFFFGYLPDQQTVDPMSEVSKAFNAYYRAWGVLVKMRDSKFPEGTVVRNRLTGHTATVIRGGLYADQVNTDRGHMGWDWLDIVPTDRDEAK